MKTKIFMSSAIAKSGKTTHTGFKPVVYDDLNQLAKAMMTKAHSSAVFSLMPRWDKYNNKWKHEYKKRKHNIAFIGNTLCYDFDNGELTFTEAQNIAKKVLKKTKFPVLLIKSKSDPKHDYDKFKMIVVTDFMFMMHRSDTSPKDYITHRLQQYKEYYHSFAKDFKFHKFMDKSTDTEERLIAQVTNDDEKKRKREYVIFTK